MPSDDLARVVEKQGDHRCRKYNTSRMKRKGDHFQLGAGGPRRVRRGCGDSMDDQLYKRKNTCFRHR